MLKERNLEQIFKRFRNIARVNWSIAGSVRNLIFLEDEDMSRIYQYDLLIIGRNGKTIWKHSMFGNFVYTIMGFYLSLQILMSASQYRMIPYVRYKLI